MDSATLASLMKMGAKVAKLLDAKNWVAVAVSLGLKAVTLKMPEPIETNLG